MEQIFTKFKGCTFLKKHTSVLEYLSEIQGSTEKHLPIIIYIYPNQPGGQVFLKNSSGHLIKTKFRLPKWILVNVLFILKEREANLTNAKTNHDKESDINRLRKEMMVSKRDLKAMRKDILVLTELVKMIRK